MTQYLGDFAEDDTVLVMFNTFTSDDPSASCTITNFTNTDVHIHKEDDLTQRNNAAGITVSVDFDGITGSHMIKIDTNNNTVAGFWVAAKDYFVRIEGTTIDGATINAVVGHFSIENRLMRGTESAYTGTPPTVIQIRTEMDSNSTRLDADVSSRNATTPPTVGEIRTEMEGAGTKLTLALGDTDELQTNQGAWLTATGFSTHDAAAVKTALEAAGSKLTLVLEDTDNLQTNQGAWLTATGFSTHDAAAVKTAIEAAGSKITLILEDTADMQPHQGDWATAVGFSTHDAAAVKTAIEAAGSKLTLTLADTDELQGNQANWATAVGFATSAALTTHDGKLDDVDTIVKRMLGLEHENAFIDNTTYSGAHMTGARVRIYSVAGSVGTINDVIATYTMTANYTGDEMDDYKVVKA